MATETLTETLRAAWSLHREDAAKAFDLFDAYCGEGTQRRRVPGIGTTERMAVRIYSGKTIEEAAAREYLYRWSLAIKAPDQCNATGRVSHDPRDHNPRACVSIFGAPHTIGL